jgi:hypothetical protein
MRIVVTSAANLQRVLWLKRGTEVSLAAPNLSPREREKFETQFNRHLSDSGSRFAVLFLVACAFGCLLFDLGQRALVAMHPVTVATVNLVLCGICAFLGKLFGWLRARWQLARLIWAVSERLERSDRTWAERPVRSEAASK